MEERLEIEVCNHFLDIPQQIQFDILSSWLSAGLDILASLDIAFCEKINRPKWLAIIAMISIEHMPTSVNCSRLIPLLEWMENRKMRMKRMIIASDWIERLNRSRFPRCLCHTQRVRIKQSPCALTPQLANDIIELFPSLVHITFEGFYSSHNDEVLTLLRAAAGNLPLCTLDLEHCMVKAIPNAVNMFAHSLRCISLNCGSLTDRSLTSLAAELQLCKHLKELTLVDLSYEVSDDLIAMLCTMHTHLTHLSLDGDKFAMEGTENLILGLLQLLPRLKRFELGSVSEACPGLSALSEMQAYCPSLIYISCPRFIYDHQERMLEVLGEEDSLELCPAPLRRLVCPLRSDKDVSVLTSRLCPSLQSLELYAQPSITDTEMSALLTQCVSLQELQLWYCKDLSDQCLEAVARCCPQLRSFECHVAKRFTDRGIAKIVRECKQLHTLKLTQCAAMTDDVWYALEKFGHNVRVVSFMNAHMTAAAVIPILLEDRLLLQKIHLPYTFERQILQALSEDVHAWRKWRRRLLFATC